jgi:transposase-like protein
MVTLRENGLSFPHTRLQAARRVMVDQGPLSFWRADDFRIAVMGTQSTSTLVRETLDRVCPYCSSHAVITRGQVTASATEVRHDYRCIDCSQNFVLLRLSG